MHSIVCIEKQVFQLFQHRVGFLTSRTSTQVLKNASPSRHSQGQAQNNKTMEMLEIYC